MKYLTLYGRLKKEIENSVYGVGTRIPHTLDLIKQYGYSLTTVNKAVRLLENDGLVKRTKSKGTYVLERRPKNYLKVRQEKRIGVLINEHLSKQMDLHVFRKAYQGMEDVCRRTGKANLVCIARDAKNMDEYLREVFSTCVSGVIAYSFYDPLLYGGLKAYKIPAVCCDFVDYNLQVPQVTVDHARAGAIALNTLMEVGHRNILFFGAFQKELVINDIDHYYWWQGIEAHARIRKMKQVRAFYFPHDETLKERMGNALRQHPECTGYICASTTFLRQAKEVVENNALFDAAKRHAVLFADLQEELLFAGNRVSLCHWDTRAMGARAAETLMELIDGNPKQPLIQYMPVDIR